MKSDYLNWLSENLHYHIYLEKKIRNLIFNEMEIHMQLCSFGL